MKLTTFLMIFASLVAAFGPISNIALEGFKHTRWLKRGQKIRKIGTLIKRTHRQQNARTMKELKDIIQSLKNQLGY